MKRYEGLCRSASEEKGVAQIWEAFFVLTEEVGTTTGGAEAAEAQV